MRKLLLLSALLIFSFSIESWGQQRTCASVEVVQQQMAADPGYARKVREAEKNFDHYIRRSGNYDPNSRQIQITIPVIVHVVYNTGEQNISDQQVQSQIDVLNEDFTASNKDYHNYDAGYTAVKGDANIEFCLIQVIHKATDKRSFGANDQVKRSKAGGSDAVDPMHALNIWVCNLGQNLLGYAYYPGVKPEIFGAVIHYKAFGRGAGYNLFSLYNLGRTSTHEIGHCLGLVHIWGDAHCGNDFVDDTPLHNAPNFGCPGPGHLSTCTGTPLEMWMNYMDYTDDPCMYFFSDGQVSRANFFIDSDPQLQSIINSGACTNRGNNQPGTVTNSGAVTSSARLTKDQFIVFPSPAHASITIGFLAEYNGIMEISVFNQSGILVLKQRIVAAEGVNTKQFDVSRLPNGIYMIQLRQYQQLRSQKIIIQH